MPRLYINNKAGRVDPERVTDPMLKNLAFRGEMPEGPEFRRKTVLMLTRYSLAVAPIALGLDLFRYVVASPLALTVFVFIAVGCVFAACSVR